MLPEAVEQNRAVTGIYSAALKLAVLMNLFTQAFNYAAEPFFFKNAAVKDAKKLYGEVAKAFTIVGCIIFLGIVLYIDLIQFFLGKDFRSGLEIVPILLIANLFLGIYYNFSIWYKLTDQTIWGAYIAIGGAIITLVLNYLWIPVFGYIGSAWAVLCCYVFMVAACYFTGRRFYPISYPIFRMTFYILVAVAIYLLSEFLRTSLDGNLVSIIAVNTLLLGSYLAFIFFRERERLQTVFIKKN